MNLKYAADGESLEHALITGEALIQLAGEAGKQGRQITANVIDITLAPDGSTPIALAGRDNVQLTFPPETGTAGTNHSRGDARRDGRAGTRADARACSPATCSSASAAASVDRAATAATLDVDAEARARARSSRRGSPAPSGSRKGR